jgi:hypothetical protein
MRRSRHIAVLLGLLSIAGCADQAPVHPPLPQQPAEPPPPPVLSPPELIPPVPPPKPHIPPRLTQEKSTLPTPAELIGLDRDGVIKMLGDPAESRNEGAAQILTYRGKSNCQLDVIFFLDMKTGTERVLSFEQQPDSGKHAVACYASLRGAK